VFDESHYEAGAAVGRELVALGHEIDLLQLKFARLSSEFARFDTYMDDGFTSPLNWIRFNCHLDWGVAADRLAVGESLGRLPESEQAIEAGEIGFAHVVVMTRTSQAVGEGFDEKDLIDKAREHTPGRFHHLCESYRHAKDPARFAKEQAEVVEQRRLKLSTWPNGILSLDGYLDAAGGAALRAALEPLARKSGPDDSRKRDQRMADALVELATGNQRTSLQVTSSVETLLGLVGSPAAETEFSVQISAETVERWACDCSLTRILLGGDSTVIEVGRAKRTVEGPTRRAVVARDRHCQWPGCDRPARWTVPHHLKHWINGGTSDPDNLALLCGRHHWMVHEGKWQMLRTDDRMIVIPPPTRFHPYLWPSPRSEAPIPEKDSA
jgi:Domain of unknown function (DUF222)/HNH endonuclease